MAGGDAERDLEVLDHQVEPEARVERAREDVALHLVPRRMVHAGRGVHDIDHDLGVEPEAAPDRERLGGGEHAEAIEEIVERLHGMAGAGGPGAEDVFSHGAEDRHDVGDIGVGAADHQRQRAVDRARPAARDRGIDQSMAEPGEIGGEGHGLRRHR